MSDIQSTTSRPQHHIHDSSEPLPGTRGANAAPDYSTGNMERTPSSAWNDSSHQSDDSRPDVARSGSASGNTAFNSERPLNVRPAPEEGGVVIGGQEGLPEGKAGFGDKAIGKAQKVAGKYTNKPELHEKGELREAGGKGAVLGNARAPHD